MKLGLYTHKIFNDNEWSEVHECHVNIDNMTEEEIEKAKNHCNICPGDNNCVKPPTVLRF